MKTLKKGIVSFITAAVALACVGALPDVPLLSGLVIPVRAATEVGSWGDLQAALNAGGEITLTDDVTAGSGDTALSVRKGATVTLDLNGHTINRGFAGSDYAGPGTSQDTPDEGGAANGGHVFNVLGTLTLNDSSDNASTPEYDGNGKITGGFCCARIEQNTPDEKYGGGIYIRDGGTVNMYGGAISGNKSQYVLYARRDEVSGGRGGGVYIASGGTFILYGGEISNNTAWWYAPQDNKNTEASGAAVYNFGGTFVMTGGTITDNHGISSVISGYPGGKTVIWGGTIAEGEKVNNYKGTFCKKAGLSYTQAGKDPATACAVTAAESANGTFTVSGGVATVGNVTYFENGKTVKLNDTPAPGYKLDCFTMNGTPVQGTSFVIDGNDVTVGAVFKIDISGTGTQDAPYQIGSTFAFVYYMENPDELRGKYIKLTADISELPYDTYSNCTIGRTCAIDFNGKTITVEDGRILNIGGYFDVDLTDNSESVNGGFRVTGENGTGRVVTGSCNLNILKGVHTTPLAGRNITISGGTVAEVTVNPDCELLVSGSPVINKVVFGGDDVRMQVKDALGDGASISVVRSKGVVFAEGYLGHDVTPEDAAKFHDYSGKYSVVLKEDGTLWLTHIHSFGYLASGATITATCTEENCDLTEGKTTLTIVAPEGLTYDGAAKAASLDGLADFNAATGLSVAQSQIKYVGVEGTSYDESATAPMNVGRYKASIKVTADNVNLSASVTYTIAPKHLNALEGDEYSNAPASDIYVSVANGNELVYDRSAHKPTATISFGETPLTESDFTISYEMESSSGGYTVVESPTAAGEYRICITGKGNYTGTVKDDFEIEPATVTVAVKDATKTYGADDPAFSATVSGLLDGDEVSCVFTRDEGENVGNYTVMYARIEGADSGNYRVTEYTPGTLAIEPAPVTVTADDQSKSYGEHDPVLTATVDGIISGEDESLIQYTLSRETGERMGEYAITPAGATKQGNYSVTYVAGKFTIRGGVKGEWVDGKLTASVAVSNPTKTLLIASVNDGSGKQERVKIIEADMGKGSYDVGFARKSGYTYRLMLVGMDSYTPLFTAWHEKVN